MTAAKRIEPESGENRRPPPSGFDKPDQLLQTVEPVIISTEPLPAADHSLSFVLRKAVQQCFNSVSFRKHCKSIGFDF